MKELTREQAESLIAKNEVVKSWTSRKNNEILVNLNLSNHVQLEVHYNMMQDLKTYFVESSDTQTEN